MRSQWLVATLAAGALYLTVATWWSTQPSTVQTMSDTQPPAAERTQAAVKRAEQATARVEAAAKRAEDAVTQVPNATTRDTAAKAHVDAVTPGTPGK